MPTVTTGKRKSRDQDHVMCYAGKASLLELLDDAETKFFNLFEEAARNGWIDGNRFLDFDQGVSHLVIKYDIPQSPE